MVQYPNLHNTKLLLLCPNFLGPKYRQKKELKFEPKPIYLVSTYVINSPVSITITIVPKIYGFYTLLVAICLIQETIRGGLVRMLDMDSLMEEQNTCRLINHDYGGSSVPINPSSG